MPCFFSLFTASQMSFVWSDEYDAADRRWHRDYVPVRPVCVRVAPLPASPTSSALEPGFQVAFLGAVLTQLLIRGKRDRSATHPETQQSASSGGHRLHMGNH